MNILDLAPLVVTETEIHELDEVACELTHNGSLLCTVHVVAMVRFCSGSMLGCENALKYWNESIRGVNVCGLCGGRTSDCWRVVPV